MQIYESFMECMTKLHVGIGVDLKGQQQEMKELTLKDYENLVMHKTTPLFMLPYKIISSLSGGIRDVTVERMIREFSLLFQLINDLISVDESSSKFGDDYVEEKYSFLVIHFMQTNEKKKIEEFLKLFRKKGKGRNDFVELNRFLSDSIKYVKAQITAIQDNLFEFKDRKPLLY